MPDYVKAMIQPKLQALMHTIPHIDFHNASTLCKSPSQLHLRLRTCKVLYAQYTVTDGVQTCAMHNTRDGLHANEYT